MMDCVGWFQQAVMSAVGAPGAPPGFAWHDADALAGLLGPHGFCVGLRQERLVYTAPSAREWLDGDSGNHPFAVAGRAVLERSGGAEAVYQRAVRILEAGNEISDGFRVTSRYVVATARRG